MGGKALVDEGEKKSGFFRVHPQSSSFPIRTIYLPA